MTHINNRLHCYKTLFKLITTHFFKSKSSVFFMFIFSILFLTIWIFLNIKTNFIGQKNSEIFMNLIVGLISFQIVSSGIQALPNAIMEFKTSVLFKRIGATPIKPIDFLISIVSYYFVLILIQFLWILLWITLIFGFYEFNDHKTGIEIIYHSGSVQWAGYITSILYTIVFTIIIGVFIALVSKTNNQEHALSMMFFFISMLLSGQLIPITQIDQFLAFKILSFLTPFRYVNELTFLSWNGFNIFEPWVQIQNPFIKVEQWEIWMSLFIPLLFISLFLALTIKFFKWSNR